MGLSSLSTYNSQLSEIKKDNRFLRTLSTSVKNNILLDLAEDLLKNKEKILEANKIDVQAVIKKNETSAFIDRLTLNEQRIEQMYKSLHQVILQKDPVGHIIETQKRPNGLTLKKIKSPLGVLLMIFEARPNVITEAFSLSLKAGNSLVMRGGSDSRETSAVLYNLICAAIKKNCKKMFFLGLQDYDRDLVVQFLKMKDIFDLVIPRGGEELIDRVQRESLVPLLKNDKGLCHAYIDEEASQDMAIDIVVNSKKQRPAVCNSLETLLVHKKIASSLLPELFQKMTFHFKDNLKQNNPVEWFFCDKSFSLINAAFQNQKNFKNIKESFCHKANEQIWQTEHLDYKINCRIVDDLDQALTHIENFSSGHSEVIVTKNPEQARRFQAEVDSAAVYWNASTRFTDGFEFGLGGEIGISTQKLHVRGPIGLSDLTSSRWVIDGEGQIRF